MDRMVLDVADADDYGSREKEDDIAAMMILDGNTNVHETFSRR